MSWTEWAKTEIQIRKEIDDTFSPEIQEALSNLVSTMGGQKVGLVEAYVCSLMLYRLVRGFPLSPLNGDDGEWKQTENGVEQNIRRPSVFRGQGRCFDLEGIMYQDSDGRLYTCSEHSTISVEFPYMPGNIIRPAQSDPCHERAENS